MPKNKYVGRTCRLKKICSSSLWPGQHAKSSRSYSICDWLDYLRDYCCNKRVIYICNANEFDYNPKWGQNWPECEVQSSELIKEPSRWGCWVGLHQTYFNGTRVWQQLIFAKFFAKRVLVGAHSWIPKKCSTIIYLYTTIRHTHTIKFVVRSSPLG